MFAQVNFSPYFVTFLQMTAGQFIAATCALVLLTSQGEAYHEYDVAESLCENKTWHIRWFKLTSTSALLPMFKPGVQIARAIDGMDLDWFWYLHCF